MKFVRQLAVIFSISFVAELMEYLIPLPVAASVYGLVLMLAGLITGIIPLEKVEGAADFLIDIMPILFVPPTVSIMTNFGVLKDMLVPLSVICITSTVLVMAVTGRVSQRLMKSGEKNAPGTEEKPEPEKTPETEKRPETEEIPEPDKTPEAGEEEKG